MALSRRSGARFAANIWPGFVDAMTALILVLFFVLSIFMVVQFILRETITGQEHELDDLSATVAGLAQALGLERQRGAQLSSQLGQLDSELDDARQELDVRAALIATLTSDRDAAREQIADFEVQVASLLAQNTSLQGDLDAEAEQARLAAARAAALQALADDLRKSKEETETELATTRDDLSDAEKQRLAEAAAAQALRDRLQNADAELTAMTLALESERKKAEETLTLLAAAEAARRQLDSSQEQTLDEISRKEAMLAQANDLLSKEKQISAEAQRQVALLNQQTRALRQQLAALQEVLDAAKAADADEQIQIDSLSASLNQALARVAQEQKRVAELEAAERKRLEEEAKDLRAYRSEFFGRIREILGDREGVQVVGDRFVFSSEVLFASGSADLGDEGKRQISRVAAVIRDISAEIPPEISWILRVDGHTDNTPLGARSEFADNWELSQARALSVVKFLIEAEGLPADRLAATGFGEFQPIDSGDSPEALARNRRIELKLTER